MRLRDPGARVCVCVCEIINSNFPSIVCVCVI